MNPLPRSFSCADRAARSIDPALNPVGVEHVLTDRYGTLDTLREDDFRSGAAAARRDEAETPGRLRRTAAPREAGPEYDRAEPCDRGARPMPPP